MRCKLSTKKVPIKACRNGRCHTRATTRKSHQYFGSHSIHLLNAHSFYSIIAKGASGGLGSGGVGSSRGAMAVSVLELHKNEELYILVGQQGENACIKSLSASREEGCGADGEELDLSKYSFSSKQHMVKNIYIENGAGGGGGGSFVFLVSTS